MTTIAQIKKDFKLAKALPHGVERAQRLIAVQRQAAASRSAAGWAIANASNLHISFTQRKTRHENQRARSIIGGIEKESGIRWAALPSPSQAQLDEFFELL